YKTSSPFRNSTMPLSTADIYAPNPTIQTFGPGVVMSGVFSQFSKSEKEKKKLKKVEEAQLRTKTFREVMHSDETKEYLRELFHLTEEEYYKKIEAFNLANREVPNLASKEEILNVLVRFFALKD
ncbi:MAG: hypothetical protein K2U26_18285, partial [Cyclobacteriaceae bacterium]|nr:hypothetical protein [Cyclobacteriaceae bacterium]